jgi:hypothetical protein
VEKIRVLVAARPRLMRELVIELISGQPDIEVIIGLESSDSRPDVCDSLFERYPHLKILALASERNSCIYYWATINIRSSRVETSEKGILDALRGRRPVGATVLIPEGSKKVN